MSTMLADTTVIRQLIPTDTIRQVLMETEIEELTDSKIDEVIGKFFSDWRLSLCIARNFTSEIKLRLNTLLLHESLDEWFFGRLEIAYHLCGIERIHMERILTVFAENVSVFFDANPYQGLILAQNERFRHVLFRDEQGFYLSLR